MSLHLNGGQVTGAWGGPWGGGVTGQFDAPGGGFGHLTLRLQSPDFDWRVDATVTRQDGSEFAGTLFDYDFTDAPVGQQGVTFVRTNGVVDAAVGR